MSIVTVRKHTRRRVGKTASLAAKMGFSGNVKVEPYKRRRPGMVAYRHQDDGTFCGDTLVEKRGLVHRNKCPHGREIEQA